MEIASPYKVAIHRERLSSYLQGRSIFPVSLELDLTSVCNRQCPHCPSTTNRSAAYLSTSQVERLFALLEGQTRGLLLTGGEPTLAPNLRETLQLAREYRFKEVVVVSNGSFLTDDNVTDALLELATAVRISLYDWNKESCTELEPTLTKLEALRERIVKEGSGLQIGVSALTSKENIQALETLVRKAESAGAHWIYFHPLCLKWDAGNPERADQTGVIERMQEIRDDQEKENFRVFFFQERYQAGEIRFQGYHAAHFLLVIGADGMNYLGAEVKYQPAHIIADALNDGDPQFLWKRKRLERIDAVSGNDYPALGSRHRGVLYNDLIERLRRSSKDCSFDALPSLEDFLFPHIL